MRIPPAGGSKLRECRTEVGATDRDFVVKHDDILPQNAIEKLPKFLQISFGNPKNSRA